jgi:N-acetylmuramoyl-L-alanine amidase
MGTSLIVRCGTLLLIASAGCRATRNLARPTPVREEAPARVGDSIVVCGQRHSIGAPVVLWTDPGGYDAYSTELRFPEEPPKEAPVGLRYQPGRAVEGELGLAAMLGSPRCLDDLRNTVDQFVLHYDVCGTSRQCFKVLHDRRKLSVHFLLDVDGTLYQTLDVSDTAWHASKANRRSVGVEIANIGAYRPGDATLDAWYECDELGPRLRYPEWMEEPGVRTPGFVARPARPERIRGEIHGVEYEMHDLTPQQYDTLAKLAAKLCELLPLLASDAPRGTDGRVRTDELSPDEFAAFHGILGHYHVTRGKQDPGPAFDWEAFLARVRAELEHHPDQESIP